MTDYKHIDIVVSLIIKGESPIGSPPSGEPNKPMTADLLSELIDDGVAGTFKVYGGLYFQGYTFTGVVNLSSREIPFPIYFEHCVFQDYLELWSAKLRTLSLSGSHLCAGADLRSSVFTGGLYLRNGFACDGPLLLRDIVVSQTIDIRNASLRFDGTEASEKESNHAGECCSLSRAKANALYWRDLAVKPQGKVNFRDVKVASFQHNIESDSALADWPEEGKLILEGFQCETMSDLAPDRALAWLGLQADIPISSLANIAKIYEKQHQTHNFKKMLSEIRKKEIAQLRQPFVRAIHKSFFSLIGYGVSPQRALYVLVFLVLIHLATLLVVEHKNGISPNINERLSDPCFFGENDECSTTTLGRYKEIKVLLHGEMVSRFIPQQYPAFNPYLYTTEDFLPLIDTGQKRYWEVSSVFLKVFLSIFAPLAFFLSGLFVGSISGLLDRKL